MSNRVKRAKNQIECENCDRLFYPADIAGGKKQRFCSAKCQREKYYVTSGRKTLSGNSIPTGTIGAITELVIASDLLKHSYSVFRALSQSCYCDLIAVDESRSVVKHVEARTGYKSLATGTMTYPKDHKPGTDTFAVYVHQSNEIFYFDLEGNEVKLY